MISLWRVEISIIGKLERVTQMKKISLLIFILTLAFALTACGNNQAEEATETTEQTNEAQEALSAFELYLLASETIEAAESLLMRSTANASINLDGFPIEMTMRSYIHQVIHSPSEIDMRIESHTTIDDEAISTLSYFRGNTLYILGDNPGEGYKISLSLDEAIQVAGAEILAFDESAILNQEVTSLAEGTALSFTLGQDAMSNTVDSMSEALSVILGDLVGDFNMQISDIDTQVVINANDIIETIDMSMSLDIEELGLSMQSTIRTEILHLGGIDIIFPDFLEDFIEF